MLPPSSPVCAALGTARPWGQMVLSISPQTAAAGCPPIPVSLLLSPPQLNATLGEDSAAPSARAEGQRPLVLQPGLCLCFCSLPLNQILFLKLHCSVWQKVFCPMPFFFPYTFFPVLSILCVFPSVFVSPSQYVRTVVSFGSCPLCSILGSCPSCLLFSASPLSTLLLAQHDQPLHLGRVACCSPGGERVGSGRALSCTGG